MPAPIVLVLKSSRSAAGAIASEVNRCWPGYEIAVARSLRDARDCLAARPVDWLLTGLGFDDGDALDLIREVCGQRVPKVLVHTNRCAPRALAWLLQWPVRGVFESHTEAADALPAALGALAQGERYFSESIRWARAHREQSGLGVFAWLTATEQIVLALIASAFGVKETAALLEMTDESVRDAVRHLHAKLGVHDTAQFIGEALRLGCVRRSPRGLAPVGLTLLRETWLSARRKFRPVKRS